MAFNFTLDASAAIVGAIVFVLTWGGCWLAWRKK